MQTESSYPAQVIAEQTASSGFVPPSWSDLAPLLKASSLLWICILLFGLARSAIYQSFHSEKFRSILKQAKRERRTRAPLLLCAKAIRNLRVFLFRNKFPETATAQFFGLPRFISGVVVCILYIIDTYMQGIPLHYYVFQCIYGVAISINLFLAFIYAERPVLFAFSLKTIVECLSIPSLMLSSGGRWLNFNFLQAYCILVEWGLLEKYDIVMRNNSTLTRLLINLFLQLLTFLFITSCGVQFFELLGDPGQTLRSETFQITWANSVYFAVVTLMTVGYGDFVPYTLLGRMWIVFHIIFAAYLVSREISLLIDALKSMRRGGGSYVNSSGTEHVVVTGRVKWEFLQQFVKEFLAEASNLDTRVIILTSNPNWTDDEWLKFVAHNPFFDHHLMYLDGSALKTDDLNRAHVGAARGVFVLADPHRRDPYKEDSDILKAVLTIRNYSGTVPIYTLNTLHESSFQFGIAMEHLDPLANDLFHRIGSVLPYSRTFLDIPQGPLTGQAFERGIQDMRSPDLSARNGIDREDSTVLDTGPHDLYSREEDFGGMANSSDGISIQGGTQRVNSRHSLSKHNGQQRKSESLCVQELETVLLAENVFCNGLSTLIANATLRVAPQSNRNDRPWLVEYKLGAECCIQQFLVPEDLDGLAFGRIGTILQDYGLVLLAVRRPTDKEWILLTVEIILEAKMVCMALSYHDHSVIGKIADHAAQFIVQESGIVQETTQGADRNELKRRPTTRSVQKLEGVGDTVKGDFRHFDSDSAASDIVEESHVTTRVPVAGGEKDMARPFPAPNSQKTIDMSDSGAPVAQQLSLANTVPKKVISRSMSTSTARDFKRMRRNFEDDIGERAESKPAAPRRLSHTGNRNRSSSQDSSRRDTRPKKSIYTNQDKLPAALRGHIIICLDGESPLINLEVLLRRIWLARAGVKKNAPVVVIHPRFPKNFPRQIGGHKDGLFLLQGNSLSLDTLKQAQYQSARAFLIMASESNQATGAGSTDSKAIFTVMTLDSLLADQDSFVCCVLDAEESLQLLRAPKQARRVGVNLGELRESDVFTYESSPMDTLPERTFSSTSLVRRLPPSPFVGNYGGSAHYGTFSGMWPPDIAANLQSRKPFNRNSRLRLKGMTRSSSMRLDHDDSSDDDDRRGSDIHTLRDQHHNQERSGEEYYERQRYASGEMVISSLFTALLAREYTDPGYIRLIRQLVGAASGSKGSWIRQIDIPEAWTRAENAIDGRTYRQTSQKLLSMGSIALGLYRSGDAAVRVETESEQWERRVSEVVYLEEEEISVLRSEAESRSIASRLINTEAYSDRRLGRAVSGHGRQESAILTGPGLRSNRVSFSEQLRTREDLDEFDKRHYTCPSTKRRIFYQEAVNGENVLPYVYCCPEPYSLVAPSDAVFVLCHPATIIPPNWGEG
ncbi:unnamed protein product [Chondrus crispus]|uniref:Calcium-activated potassium channel subunit alpha-1 n=1 Tax=Chondrus crispus TaxID=2769 RepID=R7QF10_CHOCR|nr:unnamed protein product [Chondrus crispus]CDF36684.1 unnamed protein product [Chondrus crispus]|eukprot:XP_005716503.1 unnamed protein product [Chondrus crispus]